MSYTVVNSSRLRLSESVNGALGLNVLRKSGRSDMEINGSTGSVARFVACAF